MKIRPDLFVSVGCLAVTSLCSLGIFKIGALWLEPSQLGVISIAIATATIGSFIDGSVQVALGSLLIEKRTLASIEEADLLFSKVARWVMIPSAAFYSIVSVVAVSAMHLLDVPTLSLSSTTTVAIIVLAQAPQSVSRVCFAQLYATQRQGAAFGVQGAIAVLHLILYASITPLYASPAGYAIAYAVAHTMGSVYLYRSCTQKLAHRSNVEPLGNEELKKLISATLPLLAVALAVQLSFAGQTFIVSAGIGISAVPLFIGSTRLGFLCMQIAWRTFDASAPGLHSKIVATRNVGSVISSEDTASFRLALIVATCAGTCVIAMNRWFVAIIGRPDFYLGTAFTVSLAFYLFAHTVAHGAGFALNAFGKRRQLGGVAVMNALIELTLALVLIRTFDASALLISGALVNGIIFPVCAALILREKWPQLQLREDFWWVFVSVLTLVLVSLVAISKNGDDPSLIPTMCAVCLCGYALWLLVAKKSPRRMLHFTGNKLGL